MFEMGFAVEGAEKTWVGTRMVDGQIKTHCTRTRFDLCAF
jgi:hypothetical protein